MDSNHRRLAPPDFKRPQVASRLGLSHHLSYALALGGGRLVSAPSRLDKKAGLAQDSPYLGNKGSPEFTRFSILNFFKTLRFSQSGPFGRSGISPNF